MERKRDNLELRPAIPGSVARNFWESSLAPFLEKYFVALCVCLIAIACTRVIFTYGALSLTNDEPFHLACGLEFLAKHSYQLETQHPPLARMMVALGPYLAGARPLGLSDAGIEGVGIIARSGSVDRTIFLMRLGNLPFFILACLVVGAWSWHGFGKPTAVLATGLFTLLPTILADAGLATTDMALAANLGAAFLCMILWAESPTVARSMLFGLFTALACLSKFTALGFLLIAAIVALVFYFAVSWPGRRGIWELARPRFVLLPVVAVTVIVMVWAGYRFSVGSFYTAALKLPWKHFTLPAPEFFDGIRSAVRHDQRGHPAFLLGEFSSGGWWYYFPVALAVKTPIAFLLLVALGVSVCVRKRVCAEYLMPLAFVLGILLPAMVSRIDIGIRHIEPIYLGLSIVAALGLRYLIQRARSGVAAAMTAGVLVAWMVISVAVHHPDYLAYFNGFAGKRPEEVLVDSNYDWGQDLRLLATRLQQLGVKEFSLAERDGVAPRFPQRNACLEAWYGLPTIRDGPASMPQPGWNVVSSTVAKSLSRFPESALYQGPSTGKRWYEQIAPSERVGPLLLYNIPDPGNLLNSAPVSSGGTVPQAECVAPFVTAH